MSDLPPIDISAIPESQREAVLAVLRENKSLKQETTGLQTKTSELEVLVKRLEHLIAELKNATHGKRSEKLSEDERQLAFEDLEVAVAVDDGLVRVQSEHPRLWVSFLRLWCH